MRKVYKLHNDLKRINLCGGIEMPRSHHVLSPRPEEGVRGAIAYQTMADLNTPESELPTDPHRELLNLIPRGKAIAPVSLDSMPPEAPKDAIMLFYNEGIAYIVAPSVSPQDITEAALSVRENLFQVRPGVYFLVDTMQPQALVLDSLERAMEDGATLRRIPLAHVIFGGYRDNPYKGGHEDEHAVTRALDRL